MTRSVCGMDGFASVAAATSTRGALATAAYATGTHAVPALAMPGYLASVADPTFGGIITRISDDAGAAMTGGVDKRWSNSCRHVYSTTPAWNADESRLAILSRNAVKASDGTGAPNMTLLHGSTYAPLGNIYPISPNGALATEVRWHGTNPDLLICVGEDDVWLHDISDGSNTIVITISGPTNLYIGAYQGNASHDGNRIVVIDGEARDTSGYTARLVDIGAGSVLATHTFNVPDTDSVSVSASGNYIWWNGAESAGDYDRLRIFDDTFSSLRFISTLGHPSHTDTGYDAAGNEVIMGTRKTTSEYGRILTQKLSDGTETFHTDAGEAFHQSMRNVLEPGWCCVTYPNNPARGHLVNEIAKVKLDATNTVERLCHHQSTQTDYWAQAQACPSPSGDRAVFASDWGTPNGDVSCFVVAYPEP